MVLTQFFDNIPNIQFIYIYIDIDNLYDPEKNNFENVT